MPFTTRCGRLWGWPGTGVLREGAPADLILLGRQQLAALLARLPASGRVAAPKASGPPLELRPLQVAARLPCPVGRATCQNKSPWLRPFSCRCPCQACLEPLPEACPRSALQRPRQPSGGDRNRTQRGQRHRLRAKKTVHDAARAWAPRRDCFDYSPGVAALC